MGWERCEAMQDNTLLCWSHLRMSPEERTGHLAVLFAKHMEFAKRNCTLESISPRGELRESLSICAPFISCFLLANVHPTKSYLHHTSELYQLPPKWVLGKSDPMACHVASLSQTWKRRGCLAQVGI